MRRNESSFRFGRFFGSAYKDELSKLSTKRFSPIPTLNHELLCINSIYLSKLIFSQLSTKEILIMDIKHHTSNKYVPSLILMIYLQQIPFDFHRTRQFSAKILLFSFIYKKN
jgi:hypothetical protein